MKFLRYHSTKLAVLLIIATILIIITSCSGPTVDRYSDYIRNLPKPAFSENGIKYLYIRGMVGKEQKEAFANFETIIQSDKTELVLIPDINGIIKFPVSKTLLRENPRVRNRGPSEMASEFSIEKIDYTLCYHGDPNLIWKTVKIDDFNCLLGDGYSVFYEEGLNVAAQKAYKFLKEQKALIKGITGFNPATLGIAIVRQEANYYTPSLLVSYPIWAVSEKEILNQRYQFACKIAHEWTERTLGVMVREEQQLYILPDDQRARFVFDGIAEYVAFSYDHCNILPWKRFVIKAKENGLNELNILSFDTQPLLIYYPASFTFWHSLVNKYGDDIIRDFLYCWKEEKVQSTESAIIALTKVTNDHNIKEKLELINVLDIMETIAIVCPNIEECPSVRSTCLFMYTH